MSKCEICGKDGFHKLSCTNNNVRVAVPMEIKHLINDVYQVVQDGTVWFQGDILECNAYKNKHEDE